MTVTFCRAPHVLAFLAESLVEDTNDGEWVEVDPLKGVKKTII